MKMIVVTTITSMLDVETMHAEHSVEVDDQDGMSAVSSDVLGAVLIGALRSTTRGIEKNFPRAARIGETESD